MHTAIGCHNQVGAPKVLLLWETMEGTYEL
jgi:hypothetical protein